MQEKPDGASAPFSPTKSQRAEWAFRDAAIEFAQADLAHRGVEQEWPDDLLVLCADCHSKEHGL